MTVPAGAAVFIAGQRELLVRLEQFAQTSDYRRLIIASASIAEGDVDAWLAQWLIEPAFKFGELPIDALAKPGGMKRVVQYLERIAACLDV